MTSAYSTIANVYVGSSSFRWIRNTTGQFSVWNPDNGQYREVDLPAALGLPTEVHLALDETGNAYFLGQTNGIWSIAIWNSDTLSFGSTLYITPPASQSSTSFAVANNVYWFVSQSGNIYSSPVGATDTPSLVAQAGDFLSNPLQVVTGHQDGSVWLLDNAGNVYSWDGDGFSPLSSGAPLSPPGKLSELSVVDSSLIYGLDNNGRIWQWSTFAKEFVNISASINYNGNLQFASI
ncbi:MAG: hypothetical protein VKK99_07450, partial [Cyanobacteriota bacterium]|nr:hypothetical protein [Cyanobacteriota bacterium]